jgi:hypothetical protein
MFRGWETTKIAFYRGLIGDAETYGASIDGSGLQMNPVVPPPPFSAVVRCNADFTSPHLDDQLGAGSCPTMWQSRSLSRFPWSPSSAPYFVVCIERLLSTSVAPR